MQLYAFSELCASERGENLVIVLVSQWCTEGFTPPESRAQAVLTACRPCRSSCVASHPPGLIDVNFLEKLEAVDCVGQLA